MKKISILVAAVSIILAVILFFFSLQSERIGRLDGFASCLKDKGAVFYGAFWCSHCKRQKDLFEGSAKLLNYIECSTPDGKSQTQVCKDKQIQSYPTWFFANESSASGELSLKDLSDRTTCSLPK